MFKPFRLLLAAILLTALLFGAVWALTRPQTRPRVEAGPIQAERAVSKVLTAIARDALRGKVDVALSGDDINALADAYFNGAWWKKKDEGRRSPSDFEMEHVSVDIGRQTMTLYFEFKTRGVPLFAEFHGVPTLIDHRLGFSASSMKIGAVPLPSFVASRILSRALDDPAYRKSLTMRNEIRSIRIKNGDVVLTLER